MTVTNKVVNNKQGVAVFTSLSSVVENEIMKNRAKTSWG